jgi:glycosyltransferase involved in cell wall biosynthesis
MMKISIIICTRNRADSLRETLASIASCDVDHETVELLVVDNGSSDHTRQIVEFAVMPKMALRYLHEPRTGLCFARNTGLAAALGEVIIFTDDDVRVPKGWIRQMTEPIFNGQTDAVRGTVMLAPHLERPWIQGIYRTMLAVVEAQTNESDDSIVGANMAFGRHVLAKVPEFDVELGPGASGLADDTTFGILLRKAGFRIMQTTGDAVVHHCDISRLSGEYALEWARKSGRSRAMMESRYMNCRVSCPRVRWLWVKLRCTLRSCIDRRCQPVYPEWRVYYEIHMAYFAAMDAIRQGRKPY